MDITELASLLATWIVFSDGASMALEALALLRVAGGRRWVDATTVILPLIEEHQFLWDNSAPKYRDPFEIGRPPDELFRIGRVLAMLGALAFGQGDLLRARAAEEEARAIFRSTKNPSWEGLSLWYLATFDANERKWRSAALEYRESLLAFANASGSALVHKPLIGLASIAIEISRPRLAARLLGSADEQLLRSCGQLGPFDRPMYEGIEQICQRELGDTGFTVARQHGSILDISAWTQISDEILKATRHQNTPTPKPDLCAGGILTAREQDVLRLLVEGRSNPEIADELFVGVGTAKTHVASILAKLGVPTRAAAATYAVRQGLI